MALRELTLATLEEFDGGRVAVAFALQIKRAMSDLADRPGVKVAREVMLTLKLAPIITDDGDLESVELDFHIKTKVPVQKTKTYSLEARRDGRLVYNDLADDHVNQRTLDEMTQFPDETKPETQFPDETKPE